MSSSLLHNPIQSPPVFIGANVSINQTFHASVEPSPESSEPAGHINPPPPWNDNVSYTFTPTSQWDSAYARVQAAFSDVPEIKETPLLVQYSHLPVFTQSDKVNKAWPQKTY